MLMFEDSDGVERRENKSLLLNGHGLKVDFSCFNCTYVPCYFCPYVYVLHEGLSLLGALVHLEN